MKSYSLFVLLFLMTILTSGQQTPRIEPPSWWIGMHGSKLQLMVHADGIGYTSPRLIHPGIRLTKVHKVSNADYLFLDLLIEKDARPGTIRIDFERDEDLRYTYNYEINERKSLSANRKGFGSEDVIYLLMPDRFSNGDPANDDVPGMLETADRQNPDGRHGGDLKGIMDHIDYIADMGFTAVWTNPLLENNNPAYSYHGYAITDFYRIDPRFGSNEDYRKMAEECHDKELKIIMDMVFNHCGGGHWWMNNLPSPDWIHQWPEFTRSNFRAPVISDPYASEYDKKKMQEGWFDTNMPDLNQQSQYMANYLVQNSIWWVEYAGLDGIRMDTYPYSDQEFMKKWRQRMLLEYPNFTILGETWLQKESITAYYAASEKERFGYNSHLSCLTDFPLHYAVEKAFHEDETWTTGMARLYYVLAQDFLYDDPFTNVIFPDNHDLTRYFTLMQHDLDKYKMGLAFLLTTRGIPMIYYGTEILMEGEESDGHGYIREDFPGGWHGDEVSVFLEKGLTPMQKEAKDYLQRLLQWRKGSKAITEGALTQFIPEDGVYVYFRLHEEGDVMVVINNNNTEKQLASCDRFDECLGGVRSGTDVLTGEKIADLQFLRLQPKSVIIVELD